MTTKKAAEQAASEPVAKMTKTQIVKAMAEKLGTETKQIQAFFDALAEMATEQTREAGEFTVPGLGKLVKAERKERGTQSGDRRRDQNCCENHGEVPRCKGRVRRDCAAKILMLVSDVSYLQSIVYV